MSARLLDWTPLTSSDPVPGDPDAIATGAALYRDLSEAATTAATDLAGSTSGIGMSSDAVDALMDRLSEVASDLRKIARRYSAADRALSGFADTLADLQAESIALRDRARDAVADRDDADGAAAYWEQQARIFASQGDTTGNEQAIAHVRRLNGESIAAQGRLDSSTGDALRSLVDRYNAAADAAIEQLKSEDALNDGFWDKVLDIAEVVSDIAGAIASIAGIAALVLGWVPVLGQVLAAVALVAGAIALVADLALAISGRQDWTAVIWGAVGVASFGAGRVLGAVAKSASGASKAATQSLRMQAVRAAGSGSRASTWGLPPIAKVTRHSLASVDDFARGTLKPALREANPAAAIKESATAVGGANVRSVVDGAKANWRLMTAHDASVAQRIAAFSGETSQASAIATQRVADGARIKVLAHLAPEVSEHLAKAGGDVLARAATIQTSALAGFTALTLFDFTSDAEAVAELVYPVDEGVR